MSYVTHCLTDCQTITFNVKYEFNHPPHDGSIKENERCDNMQEITDLIERLKMKHGTHLICIDITTRVFPEQRKTFLSTLYRT